MTKYHAPRIVQEESAAILRHPYITEAANLFDLPPAQNRDGDEPIQIDPERAEQAAARLAWVGYDLKVSPDAIFHAMTLFMPRLVEQPHPIPPELA